eukprot:UN19040
MLLIFLYLLSIKSAIVYILKCEIHFINALQNPNFLSFDSNFKL